MLSFGATDKVGPHRSYSKECQDLFAYYLIGEEGTFLDLGCWHPDNANNTMLLEEIGWHGLLFDVNLEAINKCKNRRLSKSFCIDVSSDVFELVLEAHWKTQCFDYISLDVDSASLKVLENILSMGIEFKCLTFEHDYYLIGEALRKPSRDLLKRFGYILLFEDVKLSDGSIWEDWWIKPDAFVPELLELIAAGKEYNMCIESLLKKQASLNNAKGFQLCE